MPCGLHMSAWDSPLARVPSWLSGKAPGTPSPTPPPACWALGAKIQPWPSLGVSCSTGRSPPLPWAQGPAPRCHSRPPLGVTCDSGSTPGLRACPCCLSGALLPPPRPVPQRPHTILLCPKPNAQKPATPEGSSGSTFTPHPLQLLQSSFAPAHSRDPGHLLAGAPRLVVSPQGPPSSLLC